MSGHMCSICLRKFTSSIGYSQHRNSCVKTVDYDNDSQIPLNPYSKSHSFTKDFKNIQDNRPKDENDMSFEVAADNNEEFFEILQVTLPNFKDIAKEIEPSKSCDKLSSSDEDNSKKYKDFLNEAYADLMALNGKEIFYREQNNGIW
ncbi:hypothetical protein F8M41_009906 [Gigaspora margarita]|uniref:Uncharacterized protein n=1 Tax=Gigaspora margarita TaxID=4874 RepID=A0A8H4AUT5_GIGMA|nr:hypothetical protein F8M41_009906 [Gigaspora margarita]